jgi:hypothetical protein
MCLGEQCDRPLATTTSLFAARHLALSHLERSLSLAIPARMKDSCAIR